MLTKVLNIVAHKYNMTLLVKFLVSVFHPFPLSVAFLSSTFNWFLLQWFQLSRMKSNFFQPKQRVTHFYQKETKKKAACGKQLEDLHSFTTTHFFTYEILMWL